MSNSSFGLCDADISLISEIFSKYPQIHKVIVYGSRAKGNYRNGSDIDMTIIDDGTMNRETFLSVLNDFEESMLPYQTDISLFRDLRNLELIEHIQRVGKAVYEKASLTALGKN